MAWDANRPVPWKKMLGLFGIYAVVALAVFSFTGGLDGGALIGLVIGGLLYVGIATLLVKFGWDPFTRATERAQAGGAAKHSSSSAPASSDSGPRPKPAPTSRTSVGPRTASATKKRPARRR
jgi:predicted lipid-binding transport protein (Tim44 family)